jgi:nucleotide-binding universal stress UspA family protein
LKQAVELAVQHRAKIDVLHVVTLERRDSEGIQKALDDYMERVEKEVFDDLASRSEAIKTRGIAVETVLVRRAHPVEGILQRIRESDPDLVVMGTHGRSALSKLILGSVTARVVLEAPCPVLTVGPDAEIVEGAAGLERILVPIDFSEVSERSIEVAESLLGSSGGLILLHVISSPVHPSLYAGGLTKLLPLHPELSSIVLKRLTELYSGPAEMLVTEGSVVQEILEAAASKKAQWIVMGTRRTQGSVTERILGRASVPVLAVKKN